MALVRLQNCTRCSLAGAGTLDGRGRHWVAVRWPTRKLTRCPSSSTSCTSDASILAFMSYSDDDEMRVGSYGRNWRDPHSCPVSSECRPNLVKIVDADHVRPRHLSRHFLVRFHLSVLRHKSSSGLHCVCVRAYPW
jgi:hypothetical protein